MRALKSGPPVRNDIIFLFTDAEELGLLGAHAFADEHPWMRDAALVLNFEGRGNSGPSMMFETSDGNRALVRELARAAPHAIANSLMYAVYERMPNDTDMTVFKRAGAAGLNFAYTHEITHYHTMLDGPEETDERSLQHHGTYALSLARRFGDLDLGRDLPAGDGDAVYFNALGSLFLHYPQSLVWPLTVLVTIAFVFVILVGLRRKLLSARGIAWGFAALFVAAVAAAAATTLAWWAARRLHPGFESLPWGAPYNMGLYEVGFVLLTTALTAFVYALAARRASAPNLLAGALLWWLLLLLPATVLLPPGTFIFAWPLLFSLAGLAFVLTLCEGSYAPTKSIIALALCTVPCVVLIAPLVHMSFVMLGVGPAGFYMILAVLALGLCAPLLTLLDRGETLDVSRGARARRVRPRHGGDTDRGLRHAQAQDEQPLLPPRRRQERSALDEHRPHARRVDIEVHRARGEQGKPRGHPPVVEAAGVEGRGARAAAPRARRGSRRRRHARRRATRAPAPRTRRAARRCCSFTSTPRRKSRAPSSTARRSRAPTRIRRAPCRTPCASPSPRRPPKGLK